MSKESIDNKSEGEISNFLNLIKNERFVLAGLIETKDRLSSGQLPDLKKWFEETEGLHEYFELDLDDLYQSEEVQTITLIPKLKTFGFEKITVEIYKNEQSEFIFYQDIHYPDFRLKAPVKSLEEINDNIHSILRNSHQAIEFNSTLSNEFQDSLNRETFLYKENDKELILFKNHVFTPLNLAGEKILILAQNLSEPYNYISSFVLDKKNQEELIKNIDFHKNSASFSSSIINNVKFFERIKKFRTLVEAFEVTQSSLKNFYDLEITIKEGELENLYADGSSILIFSSNANTDSDVSAYIEFSMENQIRYEIEDLSISIPNDINLNNFLMLFKTYLTLLKENKSQQTIIDELKKQFPEIKNN